MTPAVDDILETYGYPYEMPDVVRDKSKHDPFPDLAAEINMLKAENAELKAALRAERSANIGDAEPPPPMVTP